MMTLFFDCKGIILYEFLGWKEKIKSEHYVKTLSNLKEAVQKKRPHLWNNRNFWIHHDNASPHTSDFTTGKLKEWGLKVLPHPPNSPDCAPCDFKVFPAMKKHLKGRKFKNIDELQKETRRVLWEEVDKSVFSVSIHEIVLHWQKYSAMNGEYFEGDGVQVDSLFERLDTEGYSSDEL